MFSKFNILFITLKFLIVQLQRLIWRVYCILLILPNFVCILTLLEWNCFDIHVILCEKYVESIIINIIIIEIIVMSWRWNLLLLIVNKIIALLCVWDELVAVFILKVLVIRIIVKIHVFWLILLKTILVSRYRQVLNNLKKNNKSASKVCQKIL